MIKHLTIFSNEDFGDVRTVVKNGEVYFIAKDVCNVLGIANSRDAISQLDDDERVSVANDTLGGKMMMKKDKVGISDTMGRKQNYTVINETTKGMEYLLKKELV